uniref:Uncharacterized protein n=1 Tax=Solanum lycopersicum TaxID=4081 RepID=A0A3Q7EC95_SOLLC
MRPLSPSRFPSFPSLPTLSPSRVALSLPSLVSLPPSRSRDSHQNRRLQQPRRDAKIPRKTSNSQNPATRFSLPAPPSRANPPSFLLSRDSSQNRHKRTQKLDCPSTR